MFKEKFLSLVLIISILLPTPSIVFAQEVPADISTAQDVAAVVAEEVAEAGADAVTIVEEAQTRKDEALPAKDSASKPADDEPSHTVSALGGVDTGDPYFDAEREADRTTPTVDQNQFDGSLVYQYPLTIPPGRSGLQPEASLTYRSNNAHPTDIFGYGWDFSIPSIERLNKRGIENIYGDGYFTSSLDGELATTTAGGGGGMGGFGFAPGGFAPLRSWNYEARAFGLTTTFVFHTKWINYLSLTGWKAISTDFVATTDGFVMTTAPFEAHVPIRSTGTAIMRNNNRWDVIDKEVITDDALDMTITPIDVLDVAGKLVRGDLMTPTGLQKNVNYVVYEGAYPEGDLIYYVDFGKAPRLEKLIRINSEPTQMTYAFDVAYSDQTNLAYVNANAAPRTPARFSPLAADEEVALDHRAVAARVPGTQQRGIGFKPFQIWDSNLTYLTDPETERAIEPVTVTLRPNGNSSYILTKDVTDFITNHTPTYPVYTDTTSTFYPDPNTETSSVDGYAGQGGSQNWGDIRNGAGSSSGDSDASVTEGMWGGTSGDHIGRYIFLFDTSSITSEAPSSASLSLYITMTDEDYSDAYSYFNVVQSDPASDTALVNGDYDSFSGLTGAITKGSDDDKDISTGFTTSQYNTWTLNSTGLDWIEGQPVTKLGLAEGHDIEDVDINPGDGLENRITVSMADTTGTTQDPKLTVIHTTIAGGEGEEYWAKVENGDFRKYSFENQVWKMTDKGGTVYTFGETAASRQDDPDNQYRIFKWMLSEVRDANGNYISYTYTKDSGQIYPATITYTGNDTTDGIFDIEFTLESRTDAATTSMQGFPAGTRYRVSEIKTEINEAWVRKYTLGYTAGDNGTRSLLSSITETGQAEEGGTAALPATSFAYQDHSFGWTENTSLYLPADFTNNDGKDFGARIADFNGDGYMDIIHSNGVDDAIMYLNNDGDGSWATTTLVGFKPAFIDGTYNVDRGGRIADVNGDGLPDIIQGQGNGTVYINTNKGQSFTASTTWVVPINFYDSESGYTGDIGVRLMDINADGFVDIVQEYDGPSFNYEDNNGVYIASTTGWTLHDSWRLPTALNGEWDGIIGRDRGVRIGDFNGDEFPDLLRIWRTSATSTTATTKTMYFNNGDGSWTTLTPSGLGSASDELAFADYYGADEGARVADVNGDGLADVVYNSTSSAAIYLNKNNGTEFEKQGGSLPALTLSDGKPTAVRFADINGDGKIDFLKNGEEWHTAGDGVHLADETVPDLLSSITTDTGGTITITYKPSPQREDGSGNQLNPNMSLLVHTVETITRADGFNRQWTDTYTYGGGEYRYQDYLNRKFAGFATTTLTDAVGNVTKTYFHQGNDSQSTIGENSDSFAKIGKPYRTEMYDDSNNLFQKTISKIESSDLGNGRTFVKQTRTVDYQYDGDGDHRDTALEYTYDDDTGRLTKLIEYGEVTGSDDGTFTDSGTDDFTTVIDYAASSTDSRVGLPSLELVVDTSSTTVKETKHYYDNLAHGILGIGNETQTSQWATSTTYIDTTRTFNSYGLVTQQTDGKGNATTYTYEGNNLYPATTTNAKSQSTGYVYDYSLGAPKRVNDPHNLIFETTYDALDRVTAKKQPDLDAPGTLVTKTGFSYTDTVGARKVVRTDYLSTATSSLTYTYLDGFDRVLQERTEAEGSTYAVRDFIYDTQGKIAQESLPYFSSGTSRTASTTDGDLYARYAYDPLERITSIGTAVGTTTHSHDQWEEVITDPNGNAKDLHRDAYGRLAQVEEHDDASTYTTDYEYNYLGNLTKITDDAANVRNFEYDGLGRRTSAEDLHDTADSTFGLWTYVYDAANNLASTTDPNGVTIEHYYDELNRVTAEDADDAGGTEIAYSYDTCQYGIGRLCGATTTDSGTNYLYNALGNTASETKNIASTDYTTTYAYDRQGNMTLVTNPDASETQYNHNSAGLLEAITRKESGGSYTSVIDDIDYAPTGAMSYMLYANGVETTNTYDADELYRLRNTETTAPSGMGGMGGFGAPPGKAATAQTISLATVEPQEASVLAVRPPEMRRSRIRDMIEGNTPPSEDESADTNTPTETLEEPAVTVVNPRTTNNDGLIRSAKDAEAWQKFHRERVAYIKTQENLPPRALEAAEYAQEKFENYLLEKGYTDEYGGEVRTPLGERISLLFKGLVGLLLPERAYAYLFGTENFESCGSLPCSFDTDVSWGSVTPSLDSTSQVSGTDSLKEVVSGEGGGGMESTDYNASEIWVQFKVYIPSSMSYGASGYATLLMLEDSSDNATIWLTLEDWGTERLTVNGDVLSYTNTGIDLTEGAVNTIEMRVKIGSSTGDIDIWVDNTTEGSPDYDGSGSMNTGTDNIDDVIAGLTYAPESGVSTTYFDEVVVNNSFIGNANNAPSAPTSLLAEGQTNPTDITDSTPEFSAIYNDYDTGDIADYYQIQVASTSDFAATDWDSTKTALASSTPEGNRIADVSYAGSALASSTTYYWRIKFWDDSDEAGAWSTATSTFDLAAAAGGASPTVLQDITYTYDAVGNITNITDTSDTGAGKTVTFGYDDLYRLTSASTTAASSTPYSRTFSYSSIGNITSKSDQGSYTYAETGYANPHAATDINGTSLSYDNNGNATVFGSDAYTWNYRNQLTQTDVNGGATESNLYTDSIASGWVSGSWATTTWDSTEEVYSGSYAVKAEYGDAWDGVELDNSTGVDTTNYYYISLAVHGGSTGGQNLYAYFLDSNETALLPAMEIGDYISGGIPANDWAVARIPLTDMQAGTTTIKGFAIESDATTTVHYDEIKLTDGAGTTVQFEYDHMGQRVRNNNGSNDRIIPSRLYNLTGSTTVKHIFANGQLVASIETVGETVTPQYIHTDHLGGTNVVSDSSGDVAEVTDYYPFGEQRVNDVTSFTEQRKFIGEEFDEDTGLSYLNARYYGGSRGQFVSQDPVFRNMGVDGRTEFVLQNPQLLNSYSYARNNPLVLVDEDGELAHILIGIGAGFLGQYIYDVSNNIARDGFSGSAFTSNLSSLATYAVRGAQGGIVAGTGGLAAGYLGLGVVGQSVAVGAASGLTGVGGDLVLGEEITAQGVVSDVLIGSLSYGALSSTAKVPGRLPNFGTKAFFSGRHTQQSFLNLGADALSTSLSLLYANPSAFGQANQGIQQSSGGGSAISYSQYNALAGVRNAFNPTNDAQRKAVNQVINAFSGGR